jgi:uncharacterized protein with FMN-binding domain
MRRISFWVLSTITATVLLFGFDASQRGAGPAASPAAISGAGAGTTSGATSSSSHTSRSGSKATSPKTSASTVTGQVVQTQWGPVQVQLTVVRGSITKVSVLQYPTGNSRDVELAHYSLPVLIRETIADQSAHIDMVSGATYTSTGYIQSLQSALDRAHL